MSDQPPYRPPDQTATQYAAVLLKEAVRYAEAGQGYRAIWRAIDAASLLYADDACREVMPGFTEPTPGCNIVHSVLNGREYVTCPCGEAHAADNEVLELLRGAMSVRNGVAI